MALLQEESGWGSVQLTLQSCTKKHISIFWYPIDPHTASSLNLTISFSYLLIYLSIYPGTASSGQPPSSKSPSSLNLIISLAIY